MKKNLLIAALTMACCLMGSTKAFALGEKDGVYQIGNAADLEEFSNMVASGNGGLNAVLTADIANFEGPAISLEGEGNAYSGTFDGTKFKYTQVAAVKRGVIYVLTYGAPEDKWESHVGEVEKIIENFSFSK